eukprot:2375055-Alexandrium_andersonii.AAC.1
MPAQSGTFYMARHSNLQFAICQGPASASIRLNPQTALQKTQNRFARSELALHGPRNDLKIGPRRCRG